MTSDTELRERSNALLNGGASNEDLARESARALSALRPAEVLTEYAAVVDQSIRYLPGANINRAYMSKEDLRQEGMIALLKAASQYDAARGASFPTFARKCVDRALLGALRAADPLSERTRRDVKAINQARDSGSTSLTEATGLSSERIAEVTAADQRASGITFDPAFHSSLIHDRTELSPEDLSILTEEFQAIREALAALPARDREVVVRRVLADQPNPDVAADLGITAGRVSQILHRALGRLSASLVQ